MTMKTDELLLAQIEDKIQQADDWSAMTSGDFLDMHQKKVVMDFARSRKLPVRMVFYGGYPDAERCMPLFLPDYIQWGPNQGEDGTEVPAEISQLLRVARVKAPKGGRALTHRDYLGSVLGLGSDREVTGDILVRDQNDPLGCGADIIVESEIAEFIELNYNKAGRTNLEVSIHPIEELCMGTVNIVQKQDTVASLRLDSIVASAFALSRAKAAEAIRRGLVSVNSMEALKIDMEIEEGDKIVLRGKGKVVLTQVGGVSRKDRTRIIFDVYK